MKTTMTNLRRIIRQVIKETYTPDSEPRPYEGGFFDDSIQLMYTVKPLDMYGKPGGEYENPNQINSLKLKPGMKLTPEILVDFWYYNNRFMPKRAEKYYPVSVEVLSGKQPNPRERTGEIYDLRDVPDNPRQS